MNETLKGVAHIGTELAAAKADLQREMERHRTTWTQLEQAQRENAALKKLLDRANERMDDLKSAALSQKAEPASAQTEQQPEQSGLVEAEVETLRKDAERWRYVSLQGDDTHWLNLLRVDLEDFGGNINAAVDALIDGEAPAMAAKEV